jgi:hypothetical protein
MPQVDQIAPLEFGQLQRNQYFESMFHYHNDKAVIDEMEHRYDENKIKLERVEQVILRGSDTNFDLHDPFEGPLILWQYSLPI